jgi:hypothetical protein
MSFFMEMDSFTLPPRVKAPPRRIVAEARRAASSTRRTAEGRNGRFPPAYREGLRKSFETLSFSLGGRLMRAIGGWRACALAGMAAASAATPASAARYYFNKPGVARDAYMADVAECDELAGGVRAQPLYSPYTPNPYAAGAAAFFGALFRGAAERRLRESVERTCMADKGYARMEVNGAVIRQIQDIKDEKARLDRLFELAASPDPVGKKAAE